MTTTLTTTLTTAKTTTRPYKIVQRKVYLPASGGQLICDRDFKYEIGVVSVRKYATYEELTSATKKVIQEEIRTEIKTRYFQAIHPYVYFSDAVWTDENGVEHEDFLSE